MKRFWLLGTAALLLTAPLAAQAPELQQLDEVEEPGPEVAVAEAALEASPVWDGHNDVPEQLRSRVQNMIGTFDFYDTTNAPSNGWSEGGMHTDFRRMEQGKMGAAFWSVYVSASLPEAEAVQATLEQIDVTKRLIDRYPDKLKLALTADDVEAAWAEGKIASLMGMEGGSSIGSSLAVLRQMYALGARYLTLTHSKTLSWADSATDEPKHGGLNDFGRKVVLEMQRLGMLVDLSHVSEDTMIDVLELVQAPVIFSHSGARAINGHPRNVPDNVLEWVKGNGGIVMTVALPGYITEDLRQWQANRAAENARLKALWQGQPEEVEKGMEVWTAANPEPESTISDWADHIDHIRDVAGIDHIGLGADYDGMATGPVGAEDVAGYPALFVELAKRGYSQEDLEKIASRNMLRVLREAEAYAAAHADDPAIETPVEE